MVQNKEGMYKFYASLVETKDFYTKTVSFPSADDNMVKSSNPYYHNYEISIVTETMITEQKCHECLLLITVVNEAKMLEKSKFVIEVTQ